MEVNGIRLPVTLVNEEGPDGVIPYCFLSYSFSNICLSLDSHSHYRVLLIVGSGSSLNGSVEIER